MAAERIALLATRRYAQWKYAEAWDRISRISVVMLACDRHGVTFQEVKTEAVGKAMGTPAGDIAREALSRMGLAAPPSTGRPDAPRRSLPPLWFMA